VGKPEGQRPLGRPRHRWVYNIKMDLGAIGWGSMDWINLVQDMHQWRSLVNMVMNLWVPQSSGKSLSSCATGDLSSSAQLFVVNMTTNM
jgi:hypothetical protein